MNNNIKELFGKNLRREREKRELSQEKFAELIDIGIPALSKIECGKSYPKPGTLQKIIDTFNISPSLLFATEDVFNEDEAYNDIINRLNKIKHKRDLFKKVYERILEMTWSIDN